MYVLGESLTLSVRSKEQGKGCYIYCVFYYVNVYIAVCNIPAHTWQALSILLVSGFIEVLLRKIPMQF